MKRLKETIWDLFKRMDNDRIVSDGSEASTALAVSLKAFSAAIIGAARSNKLLLCSFAGNFILCGLGLIAAPAAYQATAAGLQRPFQMLILAGSILAAMLFVSAMGYIARGSGQNGAVRDFVGYLKRSGGFAICFIFAVLLYSLICGGFAVLAYLLLKNVLSYEAIKGIINIITCITTIAAAPLVLMELFAFTFFRLPVAETLKAGIEGSRRGYKRLLSIMAVFVLLGGLLSIGIHCLSNPLMRGVATLIVYTLVGGLGTYAVYRIGIEAYCKRQGLDGESRVCRLHEEKAIDGKGQVRDMEG